jgi:hypothetical protein
VVVVPATTLASLRRPDWETPVHIEKLASVVDMTRRADRAAARTAAGRNHRAGVR